MFDLQDKKIWVAGETGLVGRTLVETLQTLGHSVLSAPHGKLDLTDRQATLHWLKLNKPDVIVMTAGRVGGIGANSAYPAQFLYDNLAMAQNVIDGAYRAGVAKLLYLGSSCIYPKLAAQPMAENELLTGALEPTNEPYAIAKIAGLKLCEAYRRQYGCHFISAMPTNLYGPYDRFAGEDSHVIPAVMEKFHDAKRKNASSVTLWGTGKPRREFLHARDLARALILLLERYDDAGPINIGSGQETTIRELAVMMKEVTGFEGSVVFDPGRPDGSPRKLLDSSRIHAMGWSPATALRDGLMETYDWYCRSVAANPARRLSA